MTELSDLRVSMLDAQQACKDAEAKMTEARDRWFIARRKYDDAWNKYQLALSRASNDSTATTGASE